jgi:hypothetical protein
VKNGVPYDVAFSLPEADVAAYGIIFGEFEGNEFSWATMSWKERK